MSSDLTVVDLDLAFKLSTALGSALISYSGYAILAILTWPVLFLIIPMVYLTILLQVIHTPITMNKMIFSQNFYKIPTFGNYFDVLHAYVFNFGVASVHYQCSICGLVLQ